MNDRTYWLTTLDRIARPVLEAGADRTLRQRLPAENPNRRHVMHLEAVARTLVGIAPWLEGEGGDNDEVALRNELATLAQRTIASGVDPNSPDFLNFTGERQAVVDAAFLAEALLRAPRTLWSQLNADEQANTLAALRSTRIHLPAFNNWLLFSGIIEAFLCVAGAPDWDQVRIDYALRQHEQWYLGDGTYADGPDFHWDYYNSFVIQPMLIDIADALGGVEATVDSGVDSGIESTATAMRERYLERSKRYAAVQERLISPEGSYPPIGRSLVYRFGAFQTLAQMALLHRLPEGIAPSQVRAALTAVIRRQMEADGTFDDDGWLRIGFCGHQPSIAETYISSGSIYLCTAGLLPLGLPPQDVFWSDPPLPWTSRQAWSGVDIAADHALRTASRAF